MRGVLVGSSDFNRVRAHREELKRDHEGRMAAISMMSFSVKRPRIVKQGRAYVKILGKKMYLKGSEIDRAKDAGYAVHYE